MESLFPVFAQPDINTRGVGRILNSYTNPRRIVSGLNNCLEFSQPLSCLYGTMQREKVFCCLNIAVHRRTQPYIRHCLDFQSRRFSLIVGCSGNTPLSLRYSSLPANVFKGSSCVPTRGTRDEPRKIVYGGGYRHGPIYIKVKTAGYNSLHPLFLFRLHQAENFFYICQSSHPGWNVLGQPFQRVFPLLTWTSKDKISQYCQKEAPKLVRLPNLKVICLVFMVGGKFTSSFPPPRK